MSGKEPAGIGDVRFANPTEPSTPLVILPEGKTFVPQLLRVILNFAMIGGTGPDEKTRREGSSFPPRSGSREGSLGGPGLQGNLRFRAVSSA
jgi:hypothetical protein